MRVACELVLGLGAQLILGPPKCKKPAHFGR
jgi:hypothetical protein